MAEEMNRLKALGYIAFPTPTGDPGADCLRLLRENGKEKTALHCAAVAEACGKLADRFSLDRDELIAAGFAHDIGCVVEPGDMLALAEAAGWHIDGAEREYPFLLHQRWSAVLAREYLRLPGERIAAAVECHTTLRRGASACDMALFLADKLAWDREGPPPFRDAVRDGLGHSLERASLRYFRYVQEHDMVLSPHRWFLEARDWLKSMEEDSI